MNLKKTNKNRFVKYFSKTEVTQCLEKYHEPHSYRQTENHSSVTPDNDRMHNII